MHAVSFVHSDWFNGIEILQGRWQHGEKLGYCYPSGLEMSLCKWDIYVPLVTKGLKLFNEIITLFMGIIRKTYINTITAQYAGGLNIQV